MPSRAKPLCPVCGLRLGGSLTRTAKPLYCRTPACAYNHAAARCPRCGRAGYENLASVKAVASPGDAAATPYPVASWDYACRHCGKRWQVNVEVLR